MEQDLAFPDIPMVGTYSQWVSFDIFAVNLNLKIDNADIKHGKFYKHGDKDEEVKESKINKTIIQNGDHTYISACGRSGAMYGATGSFKVYNADTDEFIGKVDFDISYSGSGDGCHFKPDSKSTSKYYFKLQTGKTEEKKEGGNCQLVIMPKNY